MRIPGSFCRTTFLFTLSAILLIGQTALADFFVSAASRNSVLQFDNDGNLLGDFVTPGAGGLTDPQGIAFGPDGDLYVSSHTGIPGTNGVLRFDGLTGDFVEVFATLPDMVWPAEINFRNDHLYVSDFSFGATGRVSRFDLSGNFVDHFATGILAADGQSWDSSGNLLVSSFGDSTIKEFDGTTGAFLGNRVTGFSGGMSGPLDNLILPNGDLLVSSFNTGTIHRFDSDGNFIDIPISGLGGPQGLQIGPDGFLYVGDFATGTIYRYGTDLSGGSVFASAGTSTTNNFVFRPNSIPEPGTFAIFCIAFCCQVSRRKRI